MLPNQSSTAYIQAQLHKAFENIPPIFFEQPIADGLVDDFAEFFYINDKEDNYIKTFSEFELDSNEPWTAHIRCFSVGKL